MRKKLLVVVDYQNDFVDGALGFEKAPKIAPYIISLVKKYEEEGEDVYRLIISIGLALWAGILLYGDKI